MTKLQLRQKLLATTVSTAFMALGTIGTAHAVTVIDTTPSWNGGDSIGSFGRPFNATFGQTFTVGVDNVLNSFTFFLRQTTVAPVEFVAYVSQWDGIHATGPILYQSTSQSTTQPNIFQNFTFNTGGTNLVSGKQYVAFVSASNFPSSGQGRLGATTSNVYSGGEFVVQNNGSNFSSLTTNSWDTSFSGDAAFKASFSAQPVPEPSTILGTLTAAGFGVAAIRRKLNQQQKAMAKVG